MPDDGRLKAAIGTHLNERLDDRDVGLGLDHHR